MTGPTVRLSEDGIGFWWWHECTPYDEALLADLGEDDAAWYRKQRQAPRLLPTGPEGWTIDQAKPLTLSPSILCGTCKIHGWWRNGEWVAA